MYVSGRVDIFDMVDIDLFTIVALNMMVLKLGYTCDFEPMFYNYLRPLTSLDVELYALAYEEDVRCLTTLVRCFKLIEVCIEHGVTVLDSYLRAPRFRATLKDITDEPASSIAANRTEKMLLLTWHESSETTKEPFVPLSHLALCHNMIQVPIVRILFSVIDDVMRQLSFDETKLDGETGFVDVARSGVDSSGLSHDESFGVDDLDLNLNEPVNLNVSQVEAQSELPVSEEPDVSPTQEPILVEVSTQEPSVTEVSTQEPIVAEVSTEAPIVEEVGTQEFSVEDVIEDYVSFGKDGEDDEQGNGQEDKSAHTDGIGPTGPYSGMEAGPGLSGPTTRSKKRKNTGRAKSNLLLYNICEVFNGKIVGCRDKSVITLLEYIREYCMKRILNVQGGNNAEGSGSASRKAQQIKPAVGQDGSGGSGVGAVIGLSAVTGEGGAWDPDGAGVASQAISDNGKFPMVDEEEVTSNKLAPMAKEMIMLIEVFKETVFLPLILTSVVITKNMSAVIDNRKFMMVDEEDLIFKKISPMAEESWKCYAFVLPKKVSDLLWYNEEIREQVENLADVWRTTISYFVKKAVKNMQMMNDVGACFVSCCLFRLGGGDLREYVSVIGGTDDGDKGNDVMKDTVRQRNMCEEEMPLNNNIGKQIGDFVDMPSEAVEKRMDANVPDEIDGAKGE
nr:hypothetical protein [Tanacetum cinerariifolium]